MLSGLDVFHLIQNDTIDIAIVGGAEAPIAPMTFGAFCNVGALTSANQSPQKACKPFDIERDGFIMSEGGGYLIIEEIGHASRRNAPIMLNCSVWCYFRCIPYDQK